ncbi:hypothetical protein EVAR_4314_1 [Eumeta japonica]|uniref:Uncharacterized protein n=1 Tax=Eumeta variegata TaxID=151549 RepID=A0A4C1VCB4_EUMVA|nr:hypothetical protein EVAR_4314_1 [Eumeta japonica]
MDFHKRLMATRQTGDKSGEIDAAPEALDARIVSLTREKLVTSLLPPHDSCMRTTDKAALEHRENGCIRPGFVQIGTATGCGITGTANRAVSRIGNQDREASKSGTGPRSMSSVGLTLE